MWWAAGWTLLAVFLGITQLLGVWFSQSTGRGLLMFVAAGFFAVGWSKARGYRQRLLRKEAGEADPGVDVWSGRRLGSGWRGPLR
jgi:hypothetical protein